MLSAHEISTLIETDRGDVLSVVLDVDPTKPEHQTPNPAYRIWLRKALEDLLARLPEPGRRAAQESARRVLAHVEGTKMRGRGLVLFAAPNWWREYVLPFPLSNDVRYGRPDLMPLLWAAGEYEAYAVVVVDKTHARIAVMYLGGTSIVSEETWELDSSDWAFKSGRPSTYSRATGIGVGRGAQEDTYDARVDAHQQRFWHGVAQATARALADLHVDRLILVGPEEAAAAVRRLLPETVQRAVAGILPVHSHATVAEIPARALPLALADRHRRQSDLIAGLLDRAAAKAGAVLGRTATLDALTRGEVHTVVAGRDLDGEVWECRRCRYVSARPVEACPACGGETDRAALRQALPLLARRHGAELEIVGPELQSQLSEGIGARLRYVPPQESASPTPPGARWL